MAEEFHAKGQRFTKTTKELIFLIQETIIYFKKLILWIFIKIR